MGKRITLIMLTRGNEDQFQSTEAMLPVTGSHAKSLGAWEPGSQRPQHLKQPKHLRVAR